MGSDQNNKYKRETGFWQIFIWLIVS
jgi:hypothetical protein